jgi:hypothetical protein
MSRETEQFFAAVDAMRAETWSAWLLGKQSSYPIDLPRVETLDEALSVAVRNTGDTGDMVAIQRSHAGRGKHTLWLFTVKRSTKHGTWRESYNGGRKVFVGNLEAKQAAQIELAAPFSPALAFDAFRDDPVGRDAGVIEGVVR